MRKRKPITPLPKLTDDEKGLVLSLRIGDRFGTIAPHPKYGCLVRKFCGDIIYVKQVASLNEYELGALTTLCDAGLFTEKHGEFSLTRTGLAAARRL
ncbi:MAG: hypothetical protein AAB421_04155 [Patescibacteria group bacterium]